MSECYCNCIAFQREEFEITRQKTEQLQWLWNQMKGELEEVCDFDAIGMAIDSIIGEPCATLEGESFFKIHPLCPNEMAVLVPFCLRFSRLAGCKEQLVAVTPFGLQNMYGDIDGLVQAIERLETFYWKNRKLFNIPLDCTPDVYQEQEVLFKKMRPAYSEIYNDDETDVIASEVIKLPLLKEESVKKVIVSPLRRKWIAICNLVCDNCVCTARFIKLLIDNGIREEPFLLLYVVLECARGKMLHENLFMLLKALRRVHPENSRAMPFLNWF